MSVLPSFYSYNVIFVSAQYFSVKKKLHQYFATFILLYSIPDAACILANSAINLQYRWTLLSTLD